MEELTTSAPMSQKDKQLSPTSEKRLQILLHAARTAKAKLQVDPNGKAYVVEAIEGFADTTQGGHTDDNHKRLLYNTCLEMLDNFKQKKCPAVVIDETKVGQSSKGCYEKGVDFEHTKEVLGRGNIAGDIVVVTDKATGAEHAMKTVMITAFSENEVRAWVDLGDSGHFPSLYVFRLEDANVVFHMERIKNAVTLDDVINTHMGTLWAKDPSLVQPFSLCLMHGLLNAVQEMHDKNWTHRDLHEKNVMLKKDTMQLVVIDFGSAQYLKEESFNHEALKRDVLSTIRLLVAVSHGYTFDHVADVEKHIKDGTLEEHLTGISSLSKDGRKELLDMIMMVYNVIMDRTQAGYGNTDTVRQRIEDTLFREHGKEPQEMLTMVAEILYPEYYRDVSLKESATGKVGTGMQESDPGTAAEKRDTEEAGAGMQESDPETAAEKRATEEAGAGAEEPGLETADMSTLERDVETFSMHSA